MAPFYLAANPDYQSTLAGANRDYISALQRAFQRQQQYLLQLGSPSIARAVFANNQFAMRRRGGNPAQPGYLGGHVTNQLTPFERAQLKAIRAAGNPETGTGALAQIGQQYNQNVYDANNQFNNQNLWFSSTRAKTLSDLAREKQFSSATAINQTQNQLQDILDYILAAQQQRRAQLQQAAHSAFQYNAAQNILGGGSP